MIDKKIDDPRYLEGVSEMDDDMSDQEWFEAMGPAPESAHNVQSSSYPEDEPNYSAENAVEYTVAFIPDSRASTVVLAETVKHLIEARSISRGIVELNTAAGAAIASQLRDLHIAYDVMVFDNTHENAVLPPEIVNLHTAADQHIHVSADGLHDMDANYVVIPAISGAGQRRVDLAVDGNVGVDIGETTLPGHVIKGLQEKAETTGATQEVLYIDVPERGLVQEADGTYQRRLLHLGLSNDTDTTE